MRADARFAPNWHGFIYFDAVLCFLMLINVYITVTWIMMTEQEMNEINDEHAGIVYALCLFLVAFFECKTAFYDADGTLVMDSNKILTRYARSWLVFDVLCILSDIFPFVSSIKPIMLLRLVRDPSFALKHYRARQQHGTQQAAYATEPAPVVPNLASQNGVMLQGVAVGAAGNPSEEAFLQPAQPAQGNVVVGTIVNAGPAQGNVAVGTIVNAGPVLGGVQSAPIVHSGPIVRTT